NYELTEAAGDFFHFVRAGALTGSAQERIYINANVNHATDVMGFIVRGILDNPSAFPGLAEAKISGPADAVTRADAIVIYIDSAANRDRVLQAFGTYQQAHPDYFLPQVPLMTEPVFPGISTGAEPTDAMIETANGFIRGRLSNRSFGG